jgi:hypothetical protein
MSCHGEVAVTSALTSIQYFCHFATPTNQSTEMRPFSQQLIRATYRARYINPSLFSARHLTGTPPACKSPQGRHSVSDDSDHSAESYSKDVDSSPPADSSTYQVDSSSEAVQRPHKPPSGAYSQAGVGSEEYRMVDKRAPYDPPASGAGKKLRYGGRGQEKSGGTSHPDEGPEGGSAAGRKPEGKQ